MLNTKIVQSTTFRFRFRFTVRRYVDAKFFDFFMNMPNIKMKVESSQGSFGEMLPY